MELVKARELCISLMNVHGLGYWRFEFDNSVKRFGVCKYSRSGHGFGIIGLSAKLVLLNDEAKVRDVILHEIAHGLTRGHGHDSVWMAKCLEIGAKPERCYSNADTNVLELKYSAKCGGCGIVHQKARLKYKESRRACKCQRGKNWDEKILLEYRENIKKR